MNVTREQIFNALLQRVVSIGRLDQNSPDAETVEALATLRAEEASLRAMLDELDQVEADEERRVAWQAKYREAMIAIGEIVDTEPDAIDRYRASLVKTPEQAAASYAARHEQYGRDLKRYDGDETLQQIVRDMYKADLTRSSAGLAGRYR